MTADEEGRHRPDRESPSSCQYVSSTPPGDTATMYTMDDVVEAIGFGRFHWKLAFLCGVGYFAEITELVVVSFVAPSIQKQMGLSNFQYGLLGSSSFVGMAVGAFFWGYVSDHTGRQLSFALTVWLTFFGGFFSALSPNYAILLFLRFTAAFGIGGMLPVDYTVFLEFLPKKDRGSNIVMVDAIGVLPALTLSATIAWYFSGSEQVQWRWVLFVASIPVGIMGILRQHVPESPRYYLAAGETHLAQEIVQGVADTNEVSLPDNWTLVPQNETSISPRSPSPAAADGYSPVPAQQELSRVQPYHDENKPEGIRLDGPSHAMINIREASGIADESSGVAASSSNSHSFAELLKPPMRATTWRLWLLYFLVQFSSAGMVFALPKLFDQTFNGKSERDIAVDLLIGVVGLVPGLCIAYVVVEKSRVKSLAGFFLASGLSVVCLGIAFIHLRSNPLALVFSICLRGAMEGCFAILNTTAVESYPTVLRASGLGTAQIFDHLAGSISPLIFSLLNGHDLTRSSVFLLYAIAYIVAIAPALTLPDYAGLAVSDF